MKFFMNIHSMTLEEGQGENSQRVRGIRAREKYPQLREEGFYHISDPSNERRLLSWQGDPKCNV